VERDVARRIAATAGRDPTFERVVELVHRIDLAASARMRSTSGPGRTSSPARAAWAAA
jgi:hypothetical protein